MRNITTLWLAALVAGLAAGPGLADTNAATTGPKGHHREKGAMRCADEGGKDKPGHMGLGHALANELGLSSNQAAEVKNLMDEARQSMLKLREARDRAKSELDGLFKADPLDDQAIMAAAEKLAQVNAEMTMAMAKGRLAVNAVLTAEQRARMYEIRQKAMERFKERREGRRGHGRPGEEGGQAGGTGDQ